jgi:hypothetical protein
MPTMRKANERGEKKKETNRESLIESSMDTQIIIGQPTPFQFDTWGSSLASEARPTPIWPAYLS